MITRGLSVALALGCVVLLAAAPGPARAQCGWFGFEVHGGGPHGGWGWDGGHRGGGWYGDWDAPGRGYDPAWRRGPKCDDWGWRDYGRRGDPYGYRRGYRGGWDDDGWDRRPPRRRARDWSGCSAYGW